MTERMFAMPRVETELVGDVWPAAQPAADAVLFGRAELEPTGAFEARSLHIFTLCFTVGRYGIDDTGAIRVVFRFPADWGWLQTDDPAAPNYVTAVADNQTPLTLEYHSQGHARPWFKCLTVGVRGGCLREGDAITITFGDTAGGSPGMKMQTFCESGFEFKVLADVCATGHFVPVVASPTIAIVPGDPAVWKAVLPTLRRPGETFTLGLKAEDSWGNPTDKASETLTLEANMAVDGLPATIVYPLGRRALTIEGLGVAEEGTLRLRVSGAGGGHLCDANPLIIRDAPTAAYWADLHGQSGESIGIGTAREYFGFARDLAFLDATSHQANDFQVNNAFWAHINELTAEFHEAGRFVTLPGYEWSGNTAVGGDRNVYFRAEGRPIRRSSHALLPDTSDIDTDSPSAKHLFEDLAEEDCFVYAHVGGRYADIALAHDPRLETAMEIHSAWGSFEWLLMDGFPLGHRSGVVCNSDGHKGRPGASYPGAASFGAYGGLTCFYADELTRDGLFECIKRRHHYGTTGNRIHLDVRARFAGGARLYERDPRYFDVAPHDVDEVMMGDIAQTNDAHVTLSIEAISHTPIERIDVLNGAETVATLRGFGAADLGQRIRVVWGGAEYRGRGRDTHWRGEARFTGARIARMAKINAWNHEKLLELRGGDTVAWEAITTGNFGGFDAWLEPGAAGRLEIETNLVSGAAALADIGLDDIVYEAGGLERRIVMFRLPEDNRCLELNETVTLPLKPRGDNPIWLRVTTEDGFNAWSSPIFLYREEG